MLQRGSEEKKGGKNGNKESIKDEEGEERRSVNVRFKLPCET